MSSFEWNKIIASVLTAMIVAMVAGILASHIVAPTPLEKAVYVPPGAEAGAKPVATEAAKPAGPAPIGPFLAKADPKKGEQVAKVCLTCHDFTKGGPNKIGPNLWGVAQEKIAAVPNYQFSSALEKHKGEQWTPARLNEWLFNPQDFAQGTKMSFPGIANSQQRADVIAYLETLTPGGDATLKAAVKQAEAGSKQQKPAAAPAKGEKAPGAKPAAAPPAKTGEAPAKAAGEAPAKPASAAPAKPAAEAPASK